MTPADLTALQRLTAQCREIRRLIPSIDKWVNA